MKKICYLAGGVLYWTISLVLIGNLVLFLMGIRPFIVVSGSMEPAIKTGGVSWVNTRISPEELKTGEILAFSGNGDGMVLHRIVEVKEDGFVTKGDANEKPDAALAAKEQVRGKVVFSVPLLGYLIPEHGKTAVFLFLAGGVMLACIIQKTRENRSKRI